MKGMIPPLRNFCFFCIEKKIQDHDMQNNQRIKLNITKLLLSFE